MPGKHSAQIVLDRRAYARRLFLSLCDVYGIRPNGWGGLAELLSRGGAFRGVWWNHKERAFWVQPFDDTPGKIVDPSCVFSDERECRDGDFCCEGWVLSEEWDDDGAPMIPLSRFVTPGMTYDLIGYDVM